MNKPNENRFVRGIKKFFPKRKNSNSSKLQVKEQPIVKDEKTKSPVKEKEHVPTELEFMETKIHKY